MSALEQLNKLILNSKYVSEKDKEEYRKNTDQAELQFIKDLLKGKKHETNSIHKK